MKAIAKIFLFNLILFTATLSFIIMKYDTLSLINILMILASSFMTAMILPGLYLWYMFLVKH